jgi:hypothetical protein
LAPEIGVAFIVINLGVGVTIDNGMAFIQAGFILRFYGGNGDGSPQP